MVTAKPSGVGSAKRVVQLAQVGHLAAHQVGVARPDGGEVQHQLRRPRAAGRILAEGVQIGGDAAQGVPQPGVASARDHVEALHHGVNVGDGPHHLARDVGMVDEGSARALFIQFGERFEEAVVGGEKLAELGVIEFEARELGRVVHLFARIPQADDFKEGEEMSPDPPGRLLQRGGAMVVQWGAGRGCRSFRVCLPSKSLNGGCGPPKRPRVHPAGLEVFHNP